MSKTYTALVKVQWHIGTLLLSLLHHSVANNVHAS